MRRFILKSAVVLTVIFLTVCPVVAANDSSADGLPVRFDNIICRVASLYGVDPALVKAVVSRESKFNPIARGSRGEVGLMQIRRCVAVDWARANQTRVPTSAQLEDPYMNILVGTWNLKRALNHWKKYRNCEALALFEYNAGRTVLCTWIVHCNGDTNAVLQRGPSAKYVRTVRQTASGIRISGQRDLRLASNP